MYLSVKIFAVFLLTLFSRSTGCYPRFRKVERNEWPLPLPNDSVPPGPPLFSPTRTALHRTISPSLLDLLASACLLPCLFEGSTSDTLPGFCDTAYIAGFHCPVHGYIQPLGLIVSSHVPLLYCTICCAYSAAFGVSLCAIDCFVNIEHCNSG